MEIRASLFRRAGLPAGLALALPAAAAADSGSAKVDYLTTTSIAVKASATEYTGMAVALGNKVIAGVHVNVDADVSGKVKSWKTWLMTRPEDLGWAQHSEDAVGESYGVGDRQKSIHTNTPVHAEFSDHAVALCNHMADGLRAKGLSNEEIFSQDRVIPIAVSAAISYETTGISGTPAPTEVQPSFDMYKKFDLVCQRFVAQKNPAIGGAAGSYGVDQVAKLVSMDLDMDYQKNPTSCPTQVSAKATFRSDTPGRFSARFRSVFGQVSQPVQLEMRPQDKQGAQYVRTYTQNFMVGEPPTSDPTRTKPGKGIGGAAVGTGFAAPTRDDPGAPRPGGGGPPVAGGGKLAAPNDPMLHKDSLYLELVSAAPGSVNRSDYSEYRVKCKPTMNPDLEPVGGKTAPARSDASPSSPVRKPRFGREAREAR